MDREPESGVAEANGEEVKSPIDKLAEGLREFVREELKQPAREHEPKPHMPNWRDAFWLAIFLADVTLIFSWFPEGAKGPLEFLGKFMPWFLGGLFVVLNDWFRDHLLKISRLRWLRSVQILVLLFGVIIGVKVIPIRAAVNPPGTHLKIDGEERNPDERIWLTLGRHQVTISEGFDRQDQDKVARDRTFELAWWQLFQAAVFNSHQPDWRLTYQLDVITREKCIVTIKKQDGPFDPIFLKPLHLKNFGLIRQSDDTLRLQSSGEEKDALIELPSGSYSVEKPGCKPQTIQVDRDHSGAWKLRECPQ